jgi:hypothetical protein
MNNNETLERKGRNVSLTRITLTLVANGGLVNDGLALYERYRGLPVQFRISGHATFSAVFTG